MRGYARTGSSTSPVGFFWAGELVLALHAYATQASIPKTNPPRTLRHEADWWVAARYDLGTYSGTVFLLNIGTSVIAGACSRSRN